jgi:hypothetical protein
MLHERQHADSRLVLSDIFNSLEPDRHKVNQNHHCGTDAECVEEIGSDATLGGNARGDSSVFLFPSLDADEAKEENASADEDPPDEQRSGRRSQIFEATAIEQRF